MIRLNLRDEPGDDTAKQLLRFCAAHGLELRLVMLDCDVNDVIEHHQRIIGRIEASTEPLKTKMIRTVIGLNEIILKAKRDAEVFGATRNTVQL